MLRWNRTVRSSFLPRVHVKTYAKLSDIQILNVVSLIIPTLHFFVISLFLHIIFSKTPYYFFRTAVLL